MPSAFRNTYRFSIEQNHNQRYEVRLEARFGCSDWTLRVYFLVLSPERIPSRVGAALRFLHREEEKLWLWGADPADCSLLFQEMLERAGLHVDRRRNFPQVALTLMARVGEPLTPLFLGEFKRKLAARLTSAAHLARAAAEALAPCA